MRQESCGTAVAPLAAFTLKIRLKIFALVPGNRRGGILRLPVYCMPENLPVVLNVDVPAQYRSMKISRAVLLQVCYNIVMNTCDYWYLPEIKI